MNQQQTIDAINTLNGVLHNPNLTHEQKQAVSKKLVELVKRLG